METTFTTASSVSSATARADTEADDPEVKEDESEVLVTKPEEDAIDEDVHMTSVVPQLTTELDIPALATQGDHYDKKDAAVATSLSKTVWSYHCSDSTVCSTSTMADGRACSFANCGYITAIKVPADATLVYKTQLVQLQIIELGIHSSKAHTPGEPSTITDVAVAQTTATHSEYDDTTPNNDDAAATTAYEEPWHSPNCRSNKSRKHHKSRRSNADANYSGMFWDVDESRYAVLS